MDTTSSEPTFKNAGNRILEMVRSVYSVPLFERRIAWFLGIGPEIPGEWAWGGKEERMKVVIFGSGE